MTTIDTDVIKEMMKENTMDGYEQFDLYNPETIAKLAYHYREILKLIGENPEREGLLKTP